MENCKEINKFPQVEQFPTVDSQTVPAPSCLLGAFPLNWVIMSRFSLDSFSMRWTEQE